MGKTENRVKRHVLAVAPCSHSCPPHAQSSWLRHCSLLLCLAHCWSWMLIGLWNKNQGYRNVFRNFIAHRNHLEILLKTQAQKHHPLFSTSSGCQPRANFQASQNVLMHGSAAKQHFSTEFLDRFNWNYFFHCVNSQFLNPRLPHWISI